MTKSSEFHKEGSITRVKMTNFMSYSVAEVRPGAGFNLFVGPNGSGKSTIVTALCVCLGGDLDILNRQAELGSLVSKHEDSEKAVIEVELFREKGSNTVIACTIEKPNSISWKIDGRPAAREQLLELMERLRVQPGNMCQFLPQDVVRDFPNMSANQIFVNTVKAIGDQELLESYNKLKRLQDEVEAQEDRLSTKQKTQEGQRQNYERLEKVCKQHTEREELEKRQVTIENSLRWQEFLGLRKKVMKTKNEVEGLTQKLRELEATQIKSKESMGEYTEAVKRNKDESQKIEVRYKKKSRKLDTLDIEINNDEDQFETLEELLKEHKNEETTRQEKIEKLKCEIEKLEEEIQNFSLDPELDEKIKATFELKTKKDELLTNLLGRQPEIESQLKVLKKERDRLMEEKKRLTNMSNNKIRALERLNKDAYLGWKWVSQHRQLFKGPVHGPIMLAIELKRPEYAKYVEIHIGKQELEGFVCEDIDDVNLLTQKLREELNMHRINAFHCAPVDYEFRAPEEHSRQNLDKYTFDSYISDMFDAPNAVKAYLCKLKQLHQVPVFKEENGRTSDLRTMFKDYYIGQQKFHSKKSRYSGEYSTGVEDIANRRVIRLVIDEDRAEVNRLASEISKREEQIIVTQKSKEDNDSAIDEMTKDISRVKTDLQEFNKQRLKHINLARELQVKRANLENYLRPNFNCNERIQEIGREKETLVESLLDKQAAHCQLTTDLSQLEHEKCLLYAELCAIENKFSHVKEAAENAEREYESAQSKLEEANKDYVQQKRHLGESHAIATRITGHDPYKRYKPPIDWAEKFKEFSTDENELFVMLDDLKNQLRPLKKVSDATVKEFSQLKQKMEAASVEIESINGLINTKRKESTVLKHRWMRGVQDMKDRLDARFGGLMQELSYMGEVCLHTGDGDDTDFKNFGLVIKVKFRASEELQELSRGVQSGGEKAVTTALYILALQELTQVPFSCVDEINQGMDERNERKVWDLLLKVCKEHKAQYFYMVPKFPYGLDMNDQVRVNTCNNGRLAITKSGQAAKIREAVRAAA